MTVTLGGTGPVIPQFQSNSKTKTLEGKDKAREGQNSS